MCGSGRFLLPMLEMGFDIAGFDASQFMVHALRQKAASLSLKPHAWQGFLQDLKVGDKYGLIFIPSGSFGLITKMDEAKAALKKVYDLLSDDGLFVFEAETRQAAPEPCSNWNGTVQERSDGKSIVLSTLILPIKGDIGTTLCKYELIDGHAIEKTEIEKFQVRIYDPSDLTALLEEVGFRTVNMLKAFTPNTGPDANDEVIVYECRK
jgi:SAM-dependent methyltransferase